MSVHNHKKDKKPVNCMIITVSDTRTSETDKSGNLMFDLINENNHKIKMRDIVTDDKKKISELIEKELSGFGELFRMLSYQEDIGSAAIMSRAIAGVYKHTAIFSTPGSSGAVKLAMNRLILPELNHVVGEIKKDIKE